MKNTGRCIDYIKAKIRERGELEKLDEHTSSVLAKLKESVRRKGVEIRPEVFELYGWIFQSGLDVCDLVQMDDFSPFEMPLLLLSHLNILEA